MHSLACLLVDSVVAVCLVGAVCWIEALWQVMRERR